MTDFDPLLLALLSGGGAAASVALLGGFLHRAKLDALGRQHQETIAAARRIDADLARQALQDLEARYHRESMEAQLRHKDALQSAKDEERRIGMQALKEAEERYERKLKEQSESALSVTVHPFVNTEVEKSLLSKQHKVEVGYKYQLFVQGLPCFEPHSVVVESGVHKELNEDTIALLQSKAKDAAEAAVQIKSGGVASRVFSVAKTALKILK